MAPAGRLVLQVAVLCARIHVEMGRCKLVVKIVGARGLIPRVGQGSPSAYVELCFDGQRFHTAIKVKDQYPMWNETFYFDVSDPSNMHELVLEASVYDTNTSIATIPRRVYFLGKVTQNGASFRRFYGKQQSSKTPLALYPLEKQSEMLLVGACAELLLTAYILDETPMRAQLPNISSPCSAPMGLCVEVISAIDLSPRDEQGSTSSCVELFFDNCRHCTAIKEIDILPEWDERFYFHVWDPPNLSKLDIRAYVYYVDSSLRRPKTLLGMARIPGYSFRPLSDALSLYYPLESPGVSLGKKGELRLKVYTIANPSMRTSNPSPPMDSAIRSSPDLYVSNTLESILQIRSSGPHGVPLQHLKAITNNFSEERMLGQGAIGAVYKGVLQNGEMVAVKKIMSSLMPGQKQFENEVYRLMKLNHPNIVQFLGFCYETRNVCIECDGKHVFAEIADRLLCLEYLPEGSLDKHITDADKSELDWSTRYNIIEGICYGLCHLHDENDKPILHLDLKPPNILLSVGMVPKITDFGLSRRLDQQQTIYTSSHDGTLGYMAPELIHGGTITPKSDIFSLGVIIIEVVTGQKNYPYAITKASSDEYIKLELEKWIDVLEKSPGYGSLETDCEQIRRCIQVGLICMNPDRTKRPPIAKVISMLQGSESIDSCAHWE